jgi:molybdenum cofactor cytidylyltransferase
LSLHTLILAAGCGSRFGAELKQTALLNQQPLLMRKVALAQTVTPNAVSVVLGYRHKELQALAGSAQVVINPAWQQGLGASIACGVAALPANTQAVLLLLCDQVAITAADLRRLINAYPTLCAPDNARLPIVCAAYAGGLGVPAIFPKAHFAQLMQLAGDKGAKPLLQQHNATPVPMGNAAIDIDTQEQWQHCVNVFRSP